LPLFRLQDEHAEEAHENPMSAEQVRVLLDRQIALTRGLSDDEVPEVGGTPA